MVSVAPSGSATARNRARATCRAHRRAALRLRRAYLSLKALSGSRVRLVVLRSSQTSPLATPPTGADPVLSAVTWPLDSISLDPAGHEPPARSVSVSLPVLAIVTVVVLPLTQVMVPP